MVLKFVRSWKLFIFRKLVALYPPATDHLIPACFIYEDLPSTSGFCSSHRTIDNVVPVIMTQSLTPGMAHHLDLSNPMKSSPNNNWLVDDTS